MRCQRCEFENMPGLTTCMRCGSVLQSAQQPVDVHPPRMPAWKKPIRGFRRGIRVLFPAAAWSLDEIHAHWVPDWLQRIVRVNFVGAFCSIIPGLAHVIQHRFRSIWGWILVWLILLAAGLFLYGSTVGLVLLGLAIGVHVWIAVHSAILAEYDSLWTRFICFLVILVFFYIGYVSAGRLLFHNIRGGYAIVTAPADRVHPGDYLLGRRSQIAPADLTRGSLVLARLSGVGGHGARQRGTLAYVQILGLPGESVTLDETGFAIDGQPLDTDRYPVPGWMAGRTLSTTVPEDSYFIRAQFQGTGYNEVQIITVCTINQSRIEAKAFLRWMPLQRRGFITE